MKSVLLSCTSILGCLAVAGTPAFAQDAESGETARNAAVVEEVVVTAERRETVAQRTPVTLELISADDLEKSGVHDIYQLPTISPGVVIGQSQDSTIVTIRGVGSRNTTELGDPSVGINLDGIFFQRPPGMNAAFFDLNRVEVLLGPQGTLYGRNTAGGVINLVTNKPTQEFGGYAGLTFASFDTINSEGALNIPISDTLAVRASFMSAQHAGYRNTSLPPNPSTPAQNIPGVGSANNQAVFRSDDEDTQAGRLSVLYTPTPELSVLVSGTFSETGGTGVTYAGFPTTITSPPTEWSQVDIPSSHPGSLNVSRFNVMSQIDYDFGPVTATYLFGLVGLDLHSLHDNDGRSNIYYMYSRNEQSEDYSHEFRLSSNNTEGFVWQGGVYFYYQDLNVSDVNFLNPYGQAVVLRNFLFDVDVESRAVFGHASYDITDQLEISAGVRYTEDHKSEGGGVWGTASTNPPAAQVAANSVPINFTPNNPATSFVDGDALTYHAGLAYQATPRNLLYLNVDKGYKAGGFNSASSFGPEYVLAYSIGSKNTFFDNTLQANFSAFFYDYTDQQVTYRVASGPLANQNVTLNAGKSEITGAEAAIIWRATADDTLDLSVNWLDAEYTEFQVAQGSTNVDLSGNRGIQSPEWTVSAGYEHTFGLPNGAILTPKVQALYRSESYLTFFNSALDRQQPYTLVDVNLDYTSEDGRWTIGLFGRNLGDELLLTQAITNAPNGAIVYQVGGPPRTFGLRLRTEF